MSKEFVVSRVYDAPREQVWKAWSEGLAEWWGPKGFTIRKSAFDFRPNGVFHYAMASPQGNEMWGKFVYEEIAGPEKIIFRNGFSDADGNIIRAPFSDTWPLENRTVLTFTEQDNKTTLTLTGTPVNATDAEHATFEVAHDSMRQGFNGTLDRLADYLSQGKSPKGNTPMSDASSTKTTLTPHLTCRNAPEAIAFYQKAFGAEVLGVIDLPDGKVMHAALNIDGATLYVVDEFPEHGGTSPQALGGTPVSLHLQVGDSDAVFNRAVEAGCNVTMPLDNMFWGDRFGMVSDPYGHSWSIATTVKQLSPEEMKAAMLEAMANPSCGQAADIK